MREPEATVSCVTWNNVECDFVTKIEQEIFKLALRKVMGGPYNNTEFLEAAILLKKKMAFTLNQM